MAYELEKDYISKLPANPLSSLSSTDLDKALFKATEDLSIYHKRHITARIVVLQSIYNQESASGEYETLRKQGIASYSTKRGSIAFGGSGEYTVISPQVKEIIGDPPAMLGRFS
jgi:hypothetical protein